jgi:hypothetical protein
VRELHCGIPRHRPRKRHTRTIRDIPRSLAWLGLILVLTIGLSSVYALRQAHAAGTEPPLPNLVADPPDNVSLETSAGGGGFPSRGAAKLLLRFNGYVHNIGPGALDFRGSREKPKESKQTEEEVERYRENEEELSPKTEAELATPAMKVFQRIFTTNAGEPKEPIGHPKENEEYLERAHSEEPSAGEMVYVNADGHHHWHLQHVAKYSLWNAAKTAEVAPSQKVGFCLEDSQHVESKVGPEYPVYADNIAPYRDFCQQYRPDATSLYEGISPGWRDLYSSELAFQWVEVSDVLPGEYWLREDVNPDNVVKEAPEANTPAYASNPTIIPGFDALAQSTSAQAGEAVTVKLASRAWGDAATPGYAIASPPQHGTLGAIDGNQVIYTPSAGYTGPDSFTFTAADPHSQFPTDPAIATVSIAVAGASPRPSVSIGGAQSEMIAGTAVQLTATVSDDTGGVQWSASGGTLTPEGLEGLQSLYTAPAVPGTVTIAAQLRDDPSVSAEQTIVVVGAPVPVAAPGPGATASESSGAARGSSGSAGYKVSSPLPAVARPGVMLIGRKLVMSTHATVGGRLRLSAFLGSRRLGTCAALTPAYRVFTCRVTLGARVSLRARIGVRASLRVDSEIFRSSPAPERIPRMKMMPAGLSARAVLADRQLWCSPSTLVPTLAVSG